MEAEAAGVPTSGDEPDRAPSAEAAARLVDNGPAGQAPTPKHRRKRKRRHKRRASAEDAEDKYVGIPIPVDRNGRIRKGVLVTDFRPPSPKITTQEIMEKGWSAKKDYEHSFNHFGSFLDLPEGGDEEGGEEGDCGEDGGPRGGDRCGGGGGGGGSGADDAAYGSMSARLRNVDGRQALEERVAFLEKELVLRDQRLAQMERENAVLRTRLAKLQAGGAPA